VAIAPSGFEASRYREYTNRSQKGGGTWVRWGPTGDKDDVVVALNGGTREIEPDGHAPSDPATCVCPEKDSVLSEVVVPVPVLVNPAKCDSAEPASAALPKQRTVQGGQQNTDRDS
jgi:hypothetical protein